MIVYDFISISSTVDGCVSKHRLPVGVGAVVSCADCACEIRGGSMILLLDRRAQLPYTLTHSLCEVVFAHAER